MSYEEEDTCLPGDCETFPASLHQTNPLHVALGPDVYGYVRRHAKTHIQEAFVLCMCRRTRTTMGICT